MRSGRLISQNHVLWHTQAEQAWEVETQRNGAEVRRDLQRSWEAGWRWTPNSRRKISMLAWKLIWVCVIRVNTIQWPDMDMTKWSKKLCYDSKLGDTWYLLHLKLNQSSVAEDMLKHVCCRRSSKDSLRWFLLIRYYYHVPWEYSYTHRTTATATRVFLWRPLSLFQSWQFSNVFTNIHSCSNRLISWSAAFFFTNSSHIAHLRRCKDSAVPYFLGIYVGSVNPILRGDS